MDTLIFTPTHKKGQHLTREERYYISVRLNVDHWSVYKIAKELHRPSHIIQSIKKYRMERCICITEKSKGISLI